MLPKMIDNLILGINHKLDNERKNEELIKVHRGQVHCCLVMVELIPGGFNDSQQTQEVAFEKFTRVHTEQVQFDIIGYKSTSILSVRSMMGFAETDVVD